jgi:hypothetical protein
VTALRPKRTAKALIENRNLLLMTCSPEIAPKFIVRGRSKRDGAVTLGFAVRDQD